MKLDGIASLADNPENLLNFEIYILSMNFERDDRVRIAGRHVGFFLGYFVFFNMMYLILNWLGKMPFPMQYNEFLLVLLAAFAGGKIIAKVVRDAKS